MHDAGIRVWGPLGGMTAGFLVFALILFAASHSGEQPGSQQSAQTAATVGSKPGNAAPAQGTTAPANKPAGQTTGSGRPQ